MASALNTLPVEDAPLVSLIRGRVYVDTGDTDDASADDSITTQLPRTTRMLKLRRETAHLLNPDKPPPTRVVLQIDQDAPLHQVKQVVASVSAAGYEGVDFMVQQAPKKIDDPM